MDANFNNFASLIDSQICGFAEVVRGVEGRTGIGMLFGLLEELDESREWKPLEDLWEKPHFNPIWRFEHNGDDAEIPEDAAESVSFDSEEWGVHFDVTVVPDVKYGCKALIRWSSDGKIRSKSHFEDRVWTWENLNAVSRFLIGRIIAENADGSRGCFDNWTFLPEQEPSTKE